MQRKTYVDGDCVGVEEVAEETTMQKVEDEAVKVEGEGASVVTHVLDELKSLVHGNG